MITNANFPMDLEGRTYHVGTKRGDVANRIITVGDPARAHRLAKHLEGVHCITSKRGFVTLTGTFQDIRVSIIAIGMGTPNCDMFIREVRAIVDGPILLVRFGSCGGVGNGTKVGQIAVPHASICINRNYDYFLKQQGVPYLISEPCFADGPLSSSILLSLQETMGQDGVSVGLNATADSFYCSQGRTDPNFEDANETLLNSVKESHPDLSFLEMETFMLFHLAQCCKLNLKTAACCMIFANRNDNGFIDPNLVDDLETKAGKAVLQGLIDTPLAPDSPVDLKEL